MLLRKWKAGMSGLLCAALAALVAEPAVAAGPSKQVAIRIYERINGQPPTLIELSAMTGAASLEDAVREALKGGGYPRNMLIRLTPLAGSGNVCTYGEPEISKNDARVS